MYKPINPHRSWIFQAVGFTLIELLITLVIIGLVLALSVPAFKDIIMNNRLLSKQHSLVNSLNYARNTALSQNMSVTVCPMGAVGSTACGNSWQAGFIVVTAPAAGVPALLKSDSAGTNDPVVSVVPVNGVSAASVLFDSRGIATTQARFKVCDSRGGAYAQSINVLPTGYVQLGSTVGVAAWDGSGLVCP